MSGPEVVSAGRQHRRTLSLYAVRALDFDACFKRPDDLCDNVEVRSFRSSIRTGRSYAIRSLHIEKRQSTCFAKGLPYDRKAQTANIDFSIAPRIIFGDINYMSHAKCRTRAQESTAMKQRKPEAKLRFAISRARDNEHRDGSASVRLERAWPDEGNWRLTVQRDIESDRVASWLEKTTAALNSIGSAATMTTAGVAAL